MWYIQSPFRQTYIEYPPCSRHCARYWARMMHKTHMPLPSWCLQSSQGTNTEGEFKVRWDSANSDWWGWGAWVENQTRKLCSQNRGKLWGAWVTQSVKRPTSAQVIISQSVGSSPVSGSVLIAQSLEPVSDSVFLSLSAPPLLMVCLSKINKLLKN